MLVQCPVHELPFHSFLSSLFFPFICLFELKWFFTPLPFKHSSSRQPLQNSLVLEAASGSFGYSATHFSSLIVFRPLSVAAIYSSLAFAFYTGRLVLRFFACTTNQTDQENNVRVAREVIPPNHNNKKGYLVDLGIINHHCHGKCNIALTIQGRKH